MMIHMEILPPQTRDFSNGGYRDISLDLFDDAEGGGVLGHFVHEIPSQIVVESSGSCSNKLV